MIKSLLQLFYFISVFDCLLLFNKYFKISISIFMYLDINN